MSLARTAGSCISPHRHGHGGGCGLWQGQQDLRRGWWSPKALPFLLLLSHLHRRSRGLLSSFGIGDCQALSHTQPRCSPLPVGEMVWLSPQPGVRSQLPGWHRKGRTPGSGRPDSGFCFTPQSLRLQSVPFLVFHCVGPPSPANFGAQGSTPAPVPIPWALWDLLPSPDGHLPRLKTVTKIHLHCRKWPLLKAPQGLILFPSGRNVLTGILMHFPFSGNNNFALRKQQRNLKSLSFGPPCLKGVLETVLALGRETCFDSSEWSPTCIRALTEPLVLKSDLLFSGKTWKYSFSSSSYKMKSCKFRIL